MFLRIQDHRQAQAEALAEPEGQAHEAVTALFVAQAVFRHQRDGLRRHQPHTVHLAPAQHHTGELEVVVGGGDQPAAAALEGRRRVAERQGDVCQRAFQRRLIELGHPPALFRRDPERGVGHPQRIENTGLQHLAQGLALDARQKEAQHLGGVAVVEAVAGLVAERQLAQRLQPYVRGQWIDQRRTQFFVMGVGDGAGGAEGVGQARAVGQQVLDGDVARRRRGGVQRPGGIVQHDHVGQFRQPPGHRIGKLQLAFLDQHHHGDGGHRLGHRGDAEQGVAGHRQAGLDVAVAEGQGLDNFALAPDQGHRA